tara:strand:- start:647 stop:1309 length:663 start_codon:yes stop_codon:yes gene_type:complete
MLKALIPVRKGSERVKDKNIIPFCNQKSLLEIKIETLKKVKQIDEICVSTNCNKMKSVASKLGATVIDRDDHYCSSSVPMNDVYEYLAKNIDCNIVLYTNVTNPLVRSKTYETCIEKFFDSLTIGYDSLTTTCLVKENLWLDGKPINYDPSTHPRSQDLPDIHALNFAISIISRLDMELNRNIIGKRFFPFKLDKIEGLDIDDNDDFVLAQNLYQIHSDT